MASPDRTDRTLTMPRPVMWLVVVALVLGACSSGGESANPTSSSGATSVPPAASVPPPATTGPVTTTTTPPTTVAPQGPGPGGVVVAVLDGVDFDAVMSGLQAVGYDGCFTVHQEFAAIMGPREAAVESAKHLRSFGCFE